MKKIVIFVLFVVGCTRIEKSDVVPEDIGSAVYASHVVYDRPEDVVIPPVIIYPGAKKASYTAVCLSTGDKLTVAGRGELSETCVHGKVAVFCWGKYVHVPEGATYYECDQTHPSSSSL